MKKIILLISFVFMNPLLAKEPNKISDFYRMLAFNDQQELLVVKIKNTEFWVTPGLYSDSKEQAVNELIKQATEYGLSLTEPELRGVFNLHIKSSNKQSLRYFYSAVVKNNQEVVPENIEQIKWLPIDEAMQLITFPHINKLIKQIMDHPDKIWSGSILRFQESGQLKAKMIKGFISI